MSVLCRRAVRQDAASFSGMTSRVRRLNLQLGSSMSGVNDWSGENFQLLFVSVKAKSRHHRGRIRWITMKYGYAIGHLQDEKKTQPRRQFPRPHVFVATKGSRRIRFDEMRRTKPGTQNLTRRSHPRNHVGLQMNRKRQPIAFVWGMHLLSVFRRTSYGLVKRYTLLFNLLLLLLLILFLILILLLILISSPSFEKLLSSRSSCPRSIQQGLQPLRQFRRQPFAPGRVHQSDLNHVLNMNAVLEAKCSEFHLHQGLQAQNAVCVALF